MKVRFVKNVVIYGTENALKQPVETDALDARIARAVAFSAADGHHDAGDLAVTIGNRCELANSVLCDD